jgi:hypothetical protein
MKSLRGDQPMTPEDQRLYNLGVGLAREAAKETANKLRAQALLCACHDRDECGDDYCPDHHGWCRRKGSRWPL